MAAGFSTRSRERRSWPWGPLILAVPLGVAAGAYGGLFPDAIWARTIRFFSDTLVGVPSIVLGYAGYVILVQALGWHFSAAAACVTLAIICLPYICVTSFVLLLSIASRLIMRTR
jgi:phosphate transport system permease protein